MFLIRRNFLVACIIFMLILVTGCGGGGGGKKSTPSGGTPVAIDTVINKSNIDIAKWLDNATCAVTFTFDDNSESHYTQAAPLLERYGWRGTFFVNPGRESAIDYGEYTWDAEMRDGHRQLALKGHEIGNHGWKHDVYLSKISLEQMRSEIEYPIEKLAKIEEIGVKPLSFAHPFDDGINDTAVNSIVFENHLFSRRASIHPTDQRSFLSLFGEKATEDPITTPAMMTQSLNEVYEGKKWLIVTGHGVIPVTKDGWPDGEVTTALLEPFCEQIKSKGKVWVGTLAQVGAYEYIYQEVKLGSLQPEGNNLRVLLNWSQTDRERFSKIAVNNVPLTLILPVTSQPLNIKVYLDGKEARYDSEIGAYIGTVNIIGKDSIVISAMK